MKQGVKSSVLDGDKLLCSSAGGWWDDIKTDLKVLGVQAQNIRKGCSE
jgi:hypothetical protein